MVLKIDLIQLTIIIIIILYWMKHPILLSCLLWNLKTWYSISSDVMHNAEYVTRNYIGGIPCCTMFSRSINGKEVFPYLFKYYVITHLYVIKSR